VLLQEGSDDAALAETTQQSALFTSAGFSAKLFETPCRVRLYVHQTAPYL
jgi:hypothetical protein